MGRAADIPGFSSVAGPSMTMRIARRHPQPARRGRRFDASAPLVALCASTAFLLLPSAPVRAGITLTDETNLRLVRSQVESGDDTTENPDVTGGMAGLPLGYTESAGLFNCCGAAYGGDNLDDGDVGAGVSSDGTYAIPDSGTLTLDFGSPRTVGSIAIYNGYGNRDAGTYTLRDASGNLIGAWTIAGTVGTTNDGVDSFWLVFPAPVTTTALELQASSTEASLTVSYREVQVFEPACSDGLDNDGDGFIDLQDPGCRDASDPLETHLRPGDVVVIVEPDSVAEGEGLVVFDPALGRFMPIFIDEAGSVVSNPQDLLVEDDGHILVTDTQSRLLRFDPEDGSNTSISSGGFLSVPTGLARSSPGFVFVADSPSAAIVRIDLSTGAQTLVSNDPGFAAIQDLLLLPSDGSLLASDTTADAIFQISDPLGTPVVTVLPTTLVTNPYQMVLESPTTIVVADTTGDVPIRVDLTTGMGTALVSAPLIGVSRGLAQEESGLFLGSDGNNADGRLVRISEANDTTTVVEPGSLGALGFLDRVPRPANLTLELTDTILVDGGTPGVVDAGDTLELTAVVTNAGAGPADLLSLESGLDLHLTLVASSLSTTQGTIVEGSLATDPRLEVDLGTLAASSSATVRWEVVVSDPAPDRKVTANAWIRREKLILVESDDPTTGLSPDPNVIGVGDYGVLVQAVQKISDTRGELSDAGNRGSVLLDQGLFGFALEPLGDLDGDGVGDVAVGAETDSEGGAEAGAFYILKLNADGTVKQRSKYLPTSFPFSSSDRFGSAIAYLGDLDGAGPSDFALAIGAWSDDGSGVDRGAFYVAFMETSSMSPGVLSVTKVGDGVGGFSAGQLSDSDFFGSDIENIGDVDGDGVTDLAVGHHLRDDGILGNDSGGVWILFLNADGTVKGSQLLTPSSLQTGDFFGLAIAPLGLFDGDAVPDIAVGASARDTGGSDQGAVFVLTLNADGTIKTQTEIASGVGGLPTGLIENGDRFGRGLEMLPDLDGDGTVELLVGANRDADAGYRTGAAYVLFLRPSGAADRMVQLAPQPRVLFHELDDDDRFGVGLAPIGDLDGDGQPEIAAGAIQDDDGGSNRGAVYVLSLDSQPPDNDGDGILDSDEGTYGTDPFDPDSDDDGLLDGFEVANGFDPLDADEDTNGRIDGGDDADGDGLSNAAEQAAGTDPHDADSDDDGLLDGQEIATGMFGPQQVITTLADDARSVFAADVDGDGDSDVLSASFADDEIAWYENTDGLGTFGPQQVITTLADAAHAVIAADVDGDGDEDVLSASLLGDEIAWYPNTDGQGGFGAKQVITTLADGANSVAASDLDGDGDLDVLSTSYADDEVAWYENTDGLGGFGSQQVITNLAYSAQSVVATDVDGDGDADVLSASANDDKIAWYENTDGQGTFGPQQPITTLADSTRSVFAADVDGDGDVDVLSASVLDDEIAWYENTDGQGTFGPQQLITTLADEARSVFATDVDGDGDVDVLSSSTADDEIAWYENTDGQGTFGSQQVITTLADGAWFVIAADLDGDGDEDVLSASSLDDKIAWYEQLNVADPLDPDSDDDGLLDGDEVAAGTDPLDPDSDDDGLLDGEEVAQGLDPNAPDSDADTVCDGGDTGGGACSAGPDNCPFVWNELQTNSDGFPAGDACQCGDLDGDGVIDDDDVQAAREHVVGAIFTVPDVDPDRCNVTGPQGMGGGDDCDVADVFVLRRALAAEAVTLENACRVYSGF